MAGWRTSPEGLAIRRGGAYNWPMNRATNMLKAGSGVVGALTVRAFRLLAVAAALLWPFCLLLPVSAWAAAGVGVPYAAVAGLAMLSSRRRVL